MYIYIYKLTSVSSVSSHLLLPSPGYYASMRVCVMCVCLSTDNLAFCLMYFVVTYEWMYSISSALRTDEDSSEKSLFTHCIVKLLFLKPFSGVLVDSEVLSQLTVILILTSVRGRRLIFFYLHQEVMMHDAYVCPSANGSTENSRSLDCRLFYIVGKRQLIYAIQMYTRKQIIGRSDWIHSCPPS